MWVLPKNYQLSSAFAADMVESKEDLSLQGLNIEQSLMWRSKPSPLTNLVQKMERGLIRAAPIYTNLMCFPAQIFRNKVDIITGGYPCQPFSQAGKRQGKDDSRHLWPVIRKHMEAIRPNRVMFENVEGHISLGLSTVISDLEEDGYDATWGIFSAREVGAHHQRKRVFIMGDTKHILTIDHQK